MIESSDGWILSLGILAIVLVLPLTGWGHKCIRYSRAICALFSGIVVPATLLSVLYYIEEFLSLGSIFFTIFTMVVACFVALKNPYVGNFFIVALAAYLMSLLQCFAANYSLTCSALLSLAIAILLGCCGHASRSALIYSTSFSGAAITAVAISFLTALHRDYTGDIFSHYAPVLIGILYPLFLLSICIQLNFTAQEGNQLETTATPSPSFAAVVSPPIKEVPCSSV